MNSSLFLCLFSETKPINSMPPGNKIADPFRFSYANRTRNAPDSNEEIKIQSESRSVFLIKLRCEESRVGGWGWGWMKLGVSGRGRRERKLKSRRLHK